jgi:plastocyanin
MKMRAAAFALVGLGFAIQASADTVNVYVFSYDFSTDPTHAQIIDPVIQVGDTVHWIWQNSFHDVKSVEGSAEQFYSGFPPGGTLPFTFDHTFTQEGTFWYYCTPHGTDMGNGTAQGMAGTITVQAVPEPATMAALGLGALALVRRRRLR